MLILSTACLPGVRSASGGHGRRIAGNAGLHFAWSVMRKGKECAQVVAQRSTKDNKGKTHVLCAMTKSRMLELLQGIQAGTILKKYEFLHELATQGVPVPVADQKEMQEIALIKMIKENPEVWKYAYTSNDWDAVMVVRGKGGMLGVEFVKRQKEVSDGDQPAVPSVDG